MLALPRVSIDRLTVHHFLELMEGAVMQTSGSAARQAVEALGPRGKTTRIPGEVRGVVLAHAREARSAGQSWTQIAEKVGLSTSVLQRWNRADPKQDRQKARLMPVVIAAGTQPAVRSSLVFATVHGDRLEGLCIDDAIRLLRGLR